MHTNRPHYPFPFRRRHFLIYLFTALLLGMEMPIAMAQKFEFTVYDYGKMEDWNNPVAVFPFENNTNQTLVFLPTMVARDLRVRYPQGSIPPGGKGFVEITYYSEKAGPFNRTVEIYTNLSRKPVRLTVKGEIASLSPDALTACPTFHESAKPEQLTFKLEGIVVDITDGQPIAGATVKISQLEGYKAEAHTAQNGMFSGTIPAGLYRISVYASGYRFWQGEQYFNRNENKIRIELEPLPPPDLEFLSAGNVTQTEDNMDTLPVGNRDTDMPSGETAIPAEKTTSSPLAQEYYEPGKHAERDQGPPSYIQADSLAGKEATGGDIAREMPVKTVAPFRIPGKTKRGNPAGLNEHKEEIHPEALPVHLYKPNNVVFLIDVSRSMENPDKLPLLKEAMETLVGALRDIDRVAVITYATEPEVMLESTPANLKDSILQIIRGLHGEGMTFGLKGLQEAYQILEENRIEEGNNQIIIATDGKFSNAEQTDKDLFELVRQKMRQGYILSVVGFGDDQSAIKRMRKMAYWGKGNFIHITPEDPNKDILIQEIKEQSIREI